VFDHKLFFTREISYTSGPSWATPPPGPGPGTMFLLYSLLRSPGNRYFIRLDGTVMHYKL